MSFADDVRSVLSDTMNLPPEFLDGILQYQAENILPVGALRAPMLISTGTAGATQNVRFVGGTVSGQPTSGSYVVGDVVVDQFGTIWVCTASGGPGTWHKADGAVANGTNAGSVTTAGTTFAAGANLLSANLTLVADGLSSYRVAVRAPAWSNDTGASTNNLEIALDGANAGNMGQASSLIASKNVPCSYDGLIVTPSAGSHTVNVRFVVSAGTGTVTGGAGGSGNFSPILVILAKF